MKIIDNKKDYYDYLSGVYGIDPMATYDRRGSIIAKNELCGYLKPFRDPDIPDWGGRGEYYVDVLAGEKSWRFRVQDGEVSLFDLKEWAKNMYLEYGWTRIYNPFESEALEKAVSEKSPLAIAYSDVSCKWKIFANPILSGTPFVSYIPADEIWQAIYDYLIKMSEPKIEDNRSDIEKLESHGFDKKTSFRKV